MPEKLLAIILSLGLILGIGIFSTGNASAAPKPKPIPSTVQKIILAPTSLAATQLALPQKSIGICRVVTIALPLVAFVIISKRPTSTVAGANAAMMSFSNWVCP